MLRRLSHRVTGDLSRRSVVGPIQKRIEQIAPNIPPRAIVSNCMTVAAISWQDMQLNLTATLLPPARQRRCELRTEVTVVGRIEPDAGRPSRGSETLRGPLQAGHVADCVGLAIRVAANGGQETLS